MLEPVPTCARGRVPADTRPAPPPRSRAKQGSRGACASWQSFLQTPLAPWVQVMGATGALCPFRALHGSQEEYKSLFKERLPWRSP